MPVCLQDYLLPPIPELLGLDVPTRSQTQQQYGPSSSALALPGAGAGGLMMQAWNLPGMLGGSRGQHPGYGSRDPGQGSAQQGQSVAVVDDAIRKAQLLRDQLYGVQLMQRFDPQELRMVGKAASVLSLAPLCSNDTSDRPMLYIWINKRLDFVSMLAMTSPALSAACSLGCG